MDDIDHPYNLIPLSHLVLEGFGDGSMDRLDRQLGDDDVFLDDVGRRCVTRARAAALFAERAAQKAAQAQRQKEIQARIAEQQAKNPPIGGRPARPGSNALADMLGEYDPWT